MVQAQGPVSGGREGGWGGNALAEPVFCCQRSNVSRDFELGKNNPRIGLGQPMGLHLGKEGLAVDPESRSSSTAVPVMLIQNLLDDALLILGNHLG
jgi:hypothetical protein